MLEISGILYLLLTSKKDGSVSVSTFDAVTSRTEVLGYSRISIGRCAQTQFHRQCFVDVRIGGHYGLNSDVG